MLAETKPLSLSFAVRGYGHTADVKSGAIEIAGVKPKWIEVKPQIVKQLDGQRASTHCFKQQR